MEEIRKLLEDFLNIDFIQAVLSNPRKRDGVLKVKVRPIDKRGALYFQCESFTDTQAFHENLTAEDAVGRLTGYMENFRQMQIAVRTMNCTVLVSKKGKVSIRRKCLGNAASPAELSHNRNKKYILKEGTAIPFLQDLGVMTSEGRVVRAHFDKFRQINRFLEFIEDILPQLEKGRELQILDFGCGKSYLTFAMYYYLHELKGYDIRVTGLDLKREVIERCNHLADKYGYSKLHFLVGDIADYEGALEIDMVVTLHACDTATDYALAKAVGWDARVILSVPCCQHELNSQIESRELAPIMDYGLLKERFAALATDGLRAKYLEAAGYHTQVLEFIDMEHTPKNILLRAVRTGKANHLARQEADMCRSFLKADPVLGKLLFGNGK